jgi:hypothetical protein
MPAKLDIDSKLVEGMASVGATNVEIAAFVGCSEATIRQRFEKELAKARSGLKVKLRKKQMEVALAGNVSMLIWLGKQLLGQKEKSDVTSDDQPMASSVKVHLVRPANDKDA